MNPYLDVKGPNGERRGIFLLSVKGYDPKRAAGSSNVDATEAPEEGGYEGEYGDQGGDIDPESMEDKRLVLVTDLGLVAKRTIDGSRDVFVQSIANGLPVGGATVEVWGRNGLVLVSQVTDASGHTRLPNLAAFQREKTPVLMVVRKEGDVDAALKGADKVIVGLAAKPISEELQLTPEQFGLVGSSFFFLFAVSAVLVGFISNRVQTRHTLLIMAVVWSVVQFPMLGTVSLEVLIACRIILGAGEGPAGPVATHAIYKWFPDSQRGLPTAIIAQGSALGVSNLVTKLTDPSLFCAPCT